MTRTEGRARRSRPLSQDLLTSLGPSLRRVGYRLVIDLTDLPLFHGLSVLSRALGERIVEHCLAERLDIDVERRIRPAENPELVALGCEAVKVLAERDVVAHVPEDVEGFQHHLRAVFGTLQRERWRSRLLPDDPATPSEALVFTFPVRKNFDYRFVLDRVPAAQSNEHFFLRIAVENPRGRRLDLSSIPHVTVDDLDSREYIAGSTRIAQTLRDLVQREAERGRRSHLERRKEGSFIFAQLEKGGLGHLALINLIWSTRFGSWLAEAEPPRLDRVLKKVLLLLEDQTVRGHLGAGRSVQMADGDVQVFLDQSQQDRVLNIALDQPRRRIDIRSYLERMPMLAEVVQNRAGERPLAGLSVLLIHHITSEVLGLVTSLRELGCDALSVLFVRYAGEIPNDYLDALLDLEHTTRSFALQNVQDPDEIEGHFILSHQFSALSGLETLGKRLRATRTRYFDAMVALAVNLFVQLLQQAEAEGRQVLVIEDGGYLTPTLTRLAAEGATLGALAAEYGVDGVAGVERPLQEVLEERLLGSVEHTRSGFDRLEALERKHGGLARPVYTIAVSRIKVEEEAQEVATCILSAVESIYHALGLVLSRRRPLVIGSRGAIGSRILKALEAERLLERDPLGLDLKVDQPDRKQARRWEDLPPSRRRAVDLVIGVTGASVLGTAEAEELILHGTARTVMLVSGSSKTIEFHGIAEWIERLLAEERPKIGSKRVEILSEELLDPQTGRSLGTAFTLGFRNAGKLIEKRLIFVANLTPVNFLFYGVPTEAMDSVMSQLVRCTLGLVRAVRSDQGLAPRLYAVDRDIADHEL